MVFSSNFSELLFFFSVIFSPLFFSLSWVSDWFSDILLILINFIHFVKRKKMICLITASTIGRCSQSHLRDEQIKQNGWSFQNVSIVVSQNNHFNGRWDSYAINCILFLFCSLIGPLSQLTWSKHAGCGSQLVAVMLCLVFIILSMR